MLCNLVDFKGIYAVLARIEICREIRVFVLFLGLKYSSVLFCTLFPSLAEGGGEGGIHWGGRLVLHCSLSISMLLCYSAIVLLYHYFYQFFVLYCVIRTVHPTPACMYLWYSIYDTGNCDACYRWRKERDGKLNSGSGLVLLWYWGRGPHHSLGRLLLLHCPPPPLPLSLFSSHKTFMSKSYKTHAGPEWRVVL